MGGVTIIDLVSSLIYVARIAASLNFTRIIAMKLSLMLERSTF